VGGDNRRARTTVRQGVDASTRMIATLELGRDAARRHAWSEAADALSRADREDALSVEDLELLGTASWWAGQPDEATDALERAVAEYEAVGRREDEARVALDLAYLAARRLANAVAGGWMARAERVLATLPDSPLHATVALFGAVDQLMSGDIGTGVELADRAIDLAAKVGSLDVRYMAMSLRGMADVISGRSQEGLARLDEAAAAASSGRLGLRAASDIYCTTIAACRTVGDLDRARQWADEGERWMRRHAANGYPGICQVHRAELKMLRGDWSEAEQDARRACDELRRFRLLEGVGYAQNAVGEIRLRMGDLDGAAEAFDQAYEFGHPAQPGLALLALARGDVDEAKRSIARAVAATTTGSITDQATRGWLLPAQVEIALAAGDLETARQAVEGLEAIAADFGRPLFRAGAMTARGELLLGESKPTEASPVLDRSWRLWQSTDLPYEAAQARLHYAQALAAEGDEVTARRDLLAARAAFERLGAALDVRRVDALLGVAGEEGHGGRVDDRRRERATRTFMFTDIVTSTDLLGIIGDEAWRELLDWHDRELREAFSRHGGEAVSQTGDGFFAAFERAVDGLECAIDVQRRLARHRREHGFSPSVRIGLHTAEATRRARDYSGHGVHVAARVGAAAGRDEILATSAVLADAELGKRFRLSEPRELALKGLREPVEVRAVDWR